MEYINHTGGREYMVIFQPRHKFCSSRRWAYRWRALCKLYSIGNLYYESFQLN